MTIDKIKEMLLYGETINIECKEASGELPKSLWETYSSFANTMGGTILLGIKEHRNRAKEEDRFEITGVDNADKMLKTFWDTVNSDKVSHNILMDKDVECIDYEGKTIIAIHVPEAECAIRPIYINRNLIGGSFRRNYEGDYHCTESEVKSMLRDANENGNDGSIVENYDMNDIDMQTLHAYRHRFEVRNVDHTFNQLDDTEFLRNMGGYAYNRDTRKEGLTIAGLMMFGKGLPIRERFDNIRMDYIDKTNIEDESRWSDRLTYDGSWENNLYNFFTRVIGKLTEDLKRPFKFKGIERIDDTPVHKAVREALTNMIIHSDLLITGVLKVVKQDKEFMFSNPGSLRLPLDDIMRGGVSKARNPRIQNMFRMIGFGENIGSGYPTILKTWREQNWRKPILIERPDLRLVELTLPMMSLLPETILREMLEYYGEETYYAMSAEEQMVLAYVWNGDSVSNVELQQMLGLNSLVIGKLLHQMVDKQFLVQENKSRWATYSIQRDYLGDKSTDKGDKRSDKRKLKSDKRSDKRNDKGDKRKVLNINEIEEKIIVLVQENPNITYEALGERLSLGKTSLYKYFAHLKSLGIIHREGGRTYGAWVVSR